MRCSLTPQRTCHVPRALSLLLLLAGPTVAPGSAQAVLHVLDAPPGVDGFAASLGAVGDVDGDGVIDVAATAFDCLLRVYSGATWNELFHVAVCSAPFYGGRYAPQGLGDVNGDGRGDLLVADPLWQGVEGRVLVLSGVDGSTLHELRGASELYGWSIAALGDVDGDGVRDFASSQPGLTNPFFGVASVDVRSGRTGALLWRRYAQSTQEDLAALGPVGDLDGDGLGEFALARRPWADACLGGSCPPVLTEWFEVWSVANGRLFAVELPRISGFASVGDVDGDGGPDFALSHFDRADLPGMYGRSAVRIVSPTRGVLAEYVNLPFRVVELTPIADLDGDGVPELFAHDRWAEAERGALNVLSGATGEPLNRIVGEVGRNLGSQADAVGDLDGDGATEVVVSEAPAGSPSRILVLRTAALRPLARSCAGLPNSVGPGARLTASGLLTVADSRFVLGVEGVPPFAPALFVRGADPAALPFGDGLLCVSPFAGGLLRIEARAANAAGTATTDKLFVALCPPGYAVTAGTTWSFQCVYRDPAGGPAGFNASDALRGTFLP